MLTPQEIQEGMKQLQEGFLKPAIWNLKDEDECNILFELIWTEREFERSEIKVGQFWARLSAPGYTDCTDFGGPFETQEEAERYLVETYGGE